MTRLETAGLFGIQQWNAAKYHSDPYPTPTLSASIAHTMISRSPLHAWHQHPRLGGGSRTSSAPMDLGSVVHELLLGKGAGYEVLPYDDFRTKEAREAKAAAINAGLIPIKTDDFQEAKAVASAVRSRVSAFGIDLDSPTAMREQAMTFEVNGVACRCMMDYVDFESGVIIDLKTTEDAHPSKLRRKMVDYGYDIQEAAYRSALKYLVPELVDKEQFKFLFVEVSAPHVVLPVVSSGTMRRLGELKWQRAVETWGKCLAENKWPGYSESEVSIEPMPWAVSEFMEGEAPDIQGTTGSPK